MRKSRKGYFTLTTYARRLREVHNTQIKNNLCTSMKIKAYCACVNAVYAIKIHNKIKPYKPLLLPK